MTHRGATLDVEICARCNGLWLDAHELPAIALPLHNLPRFEVATLGRPGGGAPRCPRCDVLPYEFTVLGVCIDHCLRCGGVWLDGDEYEAIARTADERDGRPAPPPRRGVYRRSALAAIASDAIGCGVCADVIRIGDSFVWMEGLVCEPCFHARAEREPPPLEAPAARGFFQRVMQVVTTAVDWAQRCDICGCRGPSRCGHEATPPE